MITGIFVGLLTAASAIIPLFAAPRFIKNFVIDHPFATDITAAVGIYAATTTVSGSIPAILGVAVSGLCITAFLQALRSFPRLREQFMQGIPTMPLTRAAA